LSEILEREGRGVRVLRAAFFRADGKVGRIAVRTGEPLRDPKIMLRLLHQKLDALADPLDPGFGFALMRLDALLAEETKPGTISFDSDENARQPREKISPSNKTGGHKDGRNAGGATEKFAARSTRTCGFLK
jgi:hypothetical protein